MKKIISIILILAMLMPTAALAADDEIKVFLDGERIEFDVQPIIENERTLVPIRAIAEILNLDVTWAYPDYDRVTVEKEGINIIFTIGNNALIVNDNITFLDTPPIIVNDRTIVPLRAISEAFDCDVQWEEDTRTVTISSEEYDTMQYIQSDTVLSDITNNITQDENYVMSPLSLKIAMLMLADGAEGETNSELLYFARHGIRFGHGSINRVIDYIKEFKENKDSGLKIANSIWFNKSIGGKNGDFSDSFKKIISKKYFGNAEAVTSKNSIEKVNEWVDKQTNGKITNLLNEDNRDYLLALVNTIYMKADWEKPFKKENTYKETFTDINGNQNEIDFMHQTDYFRYYEDKDCQAVVLPYTNGMNMCIVVGSDEHICGKLHMLGMRDEKMRLSIPKFKIEYSTSLKNLLKATGVKKAFEDNNSDFSSMIRNVQENIKIDDVIQKAIIEVDEKGTEAAAATAVMVGPGAPKPEEIVEFKANEPFSYFIFDSFCGDILFCGRYVK